MNDGGLGTLQIGYEITEANNTLESADIQFKKLAESGNEEYEEIFQVDLAGDELNAGVFAIGDLTNQIQITNSLVDGGLYNIIFNSVDLAGNIGADSVVNVTYDVTRPYAENVTFGLQYGRQGMNDTVIVEFSEKMTASPKINLTFGLWDEFQGAENPGAPSEAGIIITRREELERKERCVPESFQKQEVLLRVE